MIDGGHLHEILGLFVDEHLFDVSLYDVKESIRQGLIEEGHLHEIMELSVNGYLSNWLTTEKAKENVCRGLIEEGHIHEIMQLCVDTHLSTWLMRQNTQKSLCIYPPKSIYTHTIYVVACKKRSVDIVGTNGLKDTIIQLNAHAARNHILGRNYILKRNNWKCGRG